MKTGPDAAVPADHARVVAQRSAVARARAAEPCLGSPKQRRTARLQSLARFDKKRAKRSFAETIFYDYRKQLADSRPRVKRRLVKRSELFQFPTCAERYDRCIRRSRSHFRPYPYFHSLLQEFDKQWFFLASAFRLQTDGRQKSLEVGDVEANQLETD